MKTRLFWMVAVFGLIYLPNNLVYGGVERRNLDISMLQTGPTKAEPAKLQKRSVAPPAVPSPSWWEAVQKGILASEYQVSRTSLPDGQGAYQAPNRAHNLKTYFTPDGIRVVPRISEKPEWTWGLNSPAMAQRAYPAGWKGRTGLLRKPRQLCQGRPERMVHQ